jgi:hypothetical protein
MLGYNEVKHGQAQGLIFLFGFNEAQPRRIHMEQGAIGGDPFDATGPGLKD